MKPWKELKAQLNDTLQRNGGKVELTHPVKVETWYQKGYIFVNVVAIEAKYKPGEHPFLLWKLDDNSYFPELDFDMTCDDLEKVVNALPKA